MNKSFIFKVVGVLLLTLLMSWAVSYVNSLVLERQYRQSEVKEKIAKSAAGEQRVMGPVLVVPYVEEYTAISTEDKIQKMETKFEQNYAYILPENLNLTGGFSHEYKKLGIYKALMYQLAGGVTGSFNVPANFKVDAHHANSRIHISPAYISLGISDPRGISTKPVFKWNGASLPFAQGSNARALGSGIHVDLPNLLLGNVAGSSAQSFNFEFQLNLRGMENFSFTPIGENNRITLHSSWQHPHFDGSFSPESVINDAGFNAKWDISSLSSNNHAAVLDMMRYGKEDSSLESIDVGFVEPITVYSQSDRATKYGLLFIGLTFAGFFIFEIIKRLRIHPAQYTFVGLAMAIFYLLLISLAERFGFALAYSLASVACVSLLGYYLTYVLKSKANGMLFAMLLTALYGALYAILASEDNALLMGSLLVFGLLALTMVVTKKVDWYQIGSKESAANLAYSEA